MTRFEVLRCCGFGLCRNEYVGTRLYGHVDSTSSCNVVFGSFNACLCHNMAGNKIGGVCGDVDSVLWVRLSAGVVPDVIWRETVSSVACCLPSLVFITFSPYYSFPVV